MLIKRAVLDEIAAGRIDLVFRRWKRATVKSGGTLKTSVGVLSIESIVPTTKDRISADDALRAGYASRQTLFDELDKRDVGTTYRIEVRHQGADPRLAIRGNANPAPQQLTNLHERLSGLDARNPAGPWTERTLRLIDARPNVRAQDLADVLGMEKATFKLNVRKLKALGLTISHSPGYEISPLGHALLAN